MAWYNPADPTQRNWMLGGIVCLVLAIPFKMYILDRRTADNAVVQTRVENLQAQNSRARVIAQRGEGELEQRMALYERHVARLEQLIPGQEEVAILLDDINSRARLVNVEVDALAPEPPEPQEFYTRTAYSMSVIGEYHSVARFLTEVASLSRIVTPVQVDLQLYANAQQYPDMVSPVIATFRIETYVLPDRSSQPAPAEVGGAQ